MPVWYFASLLAAGAAALAGRGVYRRRQQAASARAAGLVPVADLTHVPRALQASVLWLLADGGFERRVAHGVIARGSYDIDVTAFDLETLRERRGEWAYLAVDPPFRIGGVVSVVVCQIDRDLPHVLLKRAGHGDELVDDSLFDRAAHVHKLARDSLGIARSYAVEPPAALGKTPVAIALPAGWRAYGTDVAPLVDLLAAGLAATLAQTGRRDLVIELLGSLVLIYPASHDVVGADAFADLTETGLAIADRIVTSTRPHSPRGLDSRS